MKTLFPQRHCLMDRLFFGEQGQIVKLHLGGWPSCLKAVIWVKPGFSNISLWPSRWATRGPSSSSLLLAFWRAHLLIHPPASPAFFALNILDLRPSNEHSPKNVEGPSKYRAWLFGGKSDTNVKKPFLQPYRIQVVFKGSLLGGNHA